MEIFAAYIDPEITMACLVIGFVIKMWIDDVENKYIPTIVACAGLGLAVIANWGAVTIGILVGGVLSGLASTGMHQLFKQFLENGGK